MASVWSTSENTMNLTLAPDNLWRTIDATSLSEGELEEYLKKGDAVSHSLSQGTMVTCVTWDVPHSKGEHALCPLKATWGNECPLHLDEGMSASSADIKAYSIRESPGLCPFSLPCRAESKKKHSPQAEVKGLVFLLRIPLRKCGQWKELWEQMPQCDASLKPKEA